MRGAMESVIISLRTKSLIQSPNIAVTFMPWRPPNHLECWKRRHLPVESTILEQEVQK